MGKKKSNAKTFPDRAADVGYNANYLYSHIDDSAGPTACWTYKGAKHKQGYGMIGGYRIATDKKIMQTVHRLLLKIKTGSDLDGVDAIKTCGSMTCCNPSHIVAGDAKKISDLRAERGVTGMGKPLGWRATGPRKQTYIHGLDNIIAFYRNEIDVREFAIRAGITLRRAKKVCAEIKNGTLYKWLPKLEK